MKLIIDIPEEEYFVIKHYGDIPLNKTYFTAMSIINGIPLDKIRAMIERIADVEQKHDEKWATGLRYAVKVIDKYREKVNE